MDDRREIIALQLRFLIFSQRKDQSPGVFRDMALVGLCLELSFIVSLTPCFTTQLQVGGSSERIHNVKKRDDDILSGRGGEEGFGSVPKYSDQRSGKAKK